MCDIVIIIIVIINADAKITPSAAIVTLSPVLAFITCLVLLLHMVGSVR